ncbi:MAG: MAPEG family protein [Gammaproteobacteria bacterium]
MNTELLYLVLVTLLTGLMWVFYVLDRFAVWGLTDTLGYPDAPKPQSRWAGRLIKAHANGVENLVVFATLVLVAQVAGISNEVTATAAILYFWARVAHVVTYALAVPWARTVAFLAGVVAQLMIAWQLLAAA